MSLISFSFLTRKQRLNMKDFTWFPLGLENLEKWESIFQSGNFAKTGKVREFYPKYWKNQKEMKKKTQNTGKVKEICQPVVVNTLQI